MRRAGAVLVSVGLTLGMGSARAQPSASPHVTSSSTLSFWFSDDDLLHTTSTSPAADIAERSGSLGLADERVQRNTGRESLSELALQLASPGYWPEIETSAELRARLDYRGLLERGSQAPPFEDASSFLRVTYRARRPAAWALSATGYPFDADRVRLGFLRDLSWGGSDVRRDESVFPGLHGPAPAALLSFDAARVGCWLGLKTARLSETTAAGALETATNYGALAGLGARASLVQIDFALGGFEQGRFAAQLMRGARRLVLGGSARVTLAHGTHAPRVPGLFALPMPVSEPRWDTLRAGWAISAEASVLAQRLADPAGGLVMAPERGAALIASVAAGDGPWLAALGEYRDALFVLRNEPGLIASAIPPRGSRLRPELSGVLELGYHVARWHLAPSVELGARSPAVVASSAGSAARRLVVLGPHRYLLLPAGRAVRPVLAVRVGIALEASALLDGLLWLDYVVDDNAAVVPGEPGAARRLGVGLGLRARF